MQPFPYSFLNLVENLGAYLMLTLGRGSLQSVSIRVLSEMPHRFIHIRHLEEMESLESKGDYQTLSSYSRITLSDHDDIRLSRRLPSFDVTQCYIVLHRVVKLLRRNLP